MHSTGSITAGFHVFDPMWKTTRSYGRCAKISWSSASLSRRTHRQLSEPTPRPSTWKPGSSRSTHRAEQAHRARARRHGDHLVRAVGDVDAHEAEVRVALGVRVGAGPSPRRRPSRRTRRPAATRGTRPRSGSRACRWAIRRAPSAPRCARPFCLLCATMRPWPYQGSIAGVGCVVTVYALHALSS